MVKSKILPYEFIYLSMVKNISTHSKIFENGQRICELADGFGMPLHYGNTGCEVFKRGVQN